MPHRLPDEEKLTLAYAMHLKGLTPQYECSGSYGDQYCAPCPQCGGEDRFIVWMNRSDNGLGFWCRRCGASGRDVFDFFQVFDGINPYVTATEILELDCPMVIFERKRTVRSASLNKTSPAIREAKPPDPEWQEYISSILLHAQETLLNAKFVLHYLHKRGLSMQTITSSLLGYNPTEQAIVRSFGKVKIPSGYLIPNYREEQLYGVKIRLSGHAGYSNINGSLSVPIILNPSQSSTTIIVESELDALLLDQESDHSHCIIALGGSNPNVDMETHNLLQHASRIVLALDNDPPGQVAARRLQARDPSAVIRPVPVGKDPSEAYQQGFNLKQWME